jgi:hypothetical protein
MKTTAKFYNAKGTLVGEYPLYNRATFDERQDEQFDTGIIQTISSNESLSFADFCPVYIEVEDIDGTKKAMQFCGFKSLEKRSANYYVHSIELVEPTRLLMGIIIEGKKITQPIDGSAKKSLYNVLTRLLNTFETKESGLSPRLNIHTSEKVGALLRETISPEFHWEAGTLLWECLLDIGNVINAIPRLVYSFGELKGIDFDLVNEEKGEYTM